MSSILFDDLNDQEFNEALEEFYKSDSETKATNLFEQSFEDRLKSNESLINEDTEYFLLEEEMKRSELPDSIFGVPEQRKYPLDSEKHVRSAIKLFNYVDPKYEAGLARKIKRKMKEYNITDINVGEANRFSKYYHPSKKAVNEGWLVLDHNGKWTLADNYEDYEKYYNPSNLNESYYTKKDILLEELGEFLHESGDKIKYIEKDSKVIKMPKICPKCGSKMGIFIQGEPVCLCTNKDCKYYAGTVAFNQSEAGKKFKSQDESAILEVSGIVKHFCLELRDKDGNPIKDGKVLYNGEEKDIDSEEVKEKCPIPLEIFPNNMGINLCSVKSISWDRYPDTQMSNILIVFEPADEATKKEEGWYENIDKEWAKRVMEFVAYINEKCPDLVIEYAFLEAEKEDEVKDKVKGKPSPISSEAVKKALESAAEIPDPKKRSAKIREIISSTVGKLSAKIKHVFGNLKLYDNEYTYDGYIREVFPKYLDMLNAKDMYKLKQSIMEHAFTTGSGHKSLSDVMRTNQMSTDKDNYLYNLADKVRKDLSVFLHALDAKYEKARFDGSTPYKKEEEKEVDITPVKTSKDEDDEDEEETPKKEEPKKKRKSYWDVDVSEEEEEELAKESTESLQEGALKKLVDTRMTKIKDLEKQADEAREVDYPHLNRYNNIKDQANELKHKGVNAEGKGYAKTKDVDFAYNVANNRYKKSGRVSENDPTRMDIKLLKGRLGQGERFMPKGREPGEYLKKQEEKKNQSTNESAEALDESGGALKNLINHRSVEAGKLRDEADKMREAGKNKEAKALDTKADEIKYRPLTPKYPGTDSLQAEYLMYQASHSNDGEDEEAVQDYKKLLGQGKDNMPKEREPGTYLKKQEEKKNQSTNESAEILTEGVKLPKNAKAELSDNMDKLKAKQGITISPKRAATEDKTAHYDFKSKGYIPVAVLPDNDYLVYIATKKKWCVVNITDDIVYKMYDRLKYTLESTELLQEKAKIKSDDPDDAGYYETNIKIKGAKVVVCSRYHEEAEAQIKSMGKAFKNVEKSYPNVLESVANEIYNEWSKDHGEKLSRKDFTREIYKSKLQNRVIAYKDDYGFVFEFNYSINPVLGGKLLNISIYTDLDGFVASYKYELESTVRRY